MRKVLISSIISCCFLFFSQALKAQKSEELGFRTEDHLNIKFKSKKTVQSGNTIYLFESPLIEKGNDVLRKRIQVTIYQDEIEDIDKYLKSFENRYNSIGGITFYQRTADKNIKVLFYLVTPQKNDITLYNYSAIFYYNGRVYWLLLQTTFKNYKKIFKSFLDGFHLID